MALDPFDLIFKELLEAEKKSKPNNIWTQITSIEKNNRKRKEIDINFNEDEYEDEDFDKWSVKRKKYSKITKDNTIMEYNMWRNDNINNKGVTLVSVREKSLNWDNNLNKNIEIDIQKPLIELWEHQKTGINFLMNRENDNEKINCYGGLLCDDPGLGKTVQMLELIRLKNKELMNITKNRCNGTTVIIAVPVIINYWIEFIKSYYPINTFEYIILSNSNTNTNQKNVDLKENFNYYDIIFISYNLVSATYKYLQSNDIRNEIEYTSCRKFTWIFNKEFLRILCDESQMIVNRKTLYFKSIQSINAKHRWYITGTPLRNSIDDTKSAFQFIGLPERYHYDSIEKLKDILKIVMLRRTKSDKEVKNSIMKYPECLIEIKLLDFNNKNEKLIYDYYDNRIDSIVKNKYIQNDILVFITKIKQSCINSLIIDDDIIKKYNIPKFSTKGIEIIKYINNQTAIDDKIIIYYDSIKALKQLTYELTYYNISHLLITSENKDSEREFFINKFKNDNIRVLLFTKICNQGISLVCASHILILGPGWTPWHEKQAICRLYRPRQTKITKVVYFIIKNSFEQYIINRSFNKLEMSNNLFNSSNDNDDDSNFKITHYLEWKKKENDSDNFKTHYTNLISNFINK
jgi:SNF2 family DNA or RNA helicase